MNATNARALDAQLAAGISADIAAANAHLVRRADAAADLVIALLAVATLAAIALGWLP